MTGRSLKGHAHDSPFRQKDAHEGSATFSPETGDRVSPVFLIHQEGSGHGLFPDDYLPKESKSARKDGAHPASPGSGPEGMFCRNCRNAKRIGYHTRKYIKCWVMRDLWTHGPGSDIRLKDKACSEFDPMKDGEKRETMWVA